MKGRWIGRVVRFGSLLVMLVIVVFILTACLSAGPQVPGGTPVWQQQLDGDINASPYIHKGRIYVGSAGGTMYCLNARSGEVQWTFDSGAAIPGKAAAEDGSLFFGNAGGTLFAVDTRSGKQAQYPLLSGCRTRDG
jgi:outer membrane protein assembly factor BamB